MPRRTFMSLVSLGLHWICSPRDRLTMLAILVALSGSVYADVAADTAAAKISPTHADVAYGPDERNVLDLYLAESKQRTPLVLYIHGGGFKAGDKDRLRQRDLSRFLEMGCSVASINYRLTQTSPAPAAYMDCGRALQYLRYHADQWNIDPDLVASTGGSAGAGTSLWLAFHDDLADPSSDDPVARQSTRLVCVAVTNGQSSYDPRFIESIGLPRRVFERHSFFLPFYGIRDDEIDTPKAYRRYEEMAPLTHLTPDDPPALLEYGHPNTPVDDDSNVSLVVHHPRFGIALKERMDAIRVECIVQYLSADRSSKIRHGKPAPVTDRFEFLERQFQRAGHQKVGNAPTAKSGS